MSIESCEEDKGSGIFLRVEQNSYTTLFHLDGCSGKGHLALHLIARHPLSLPAAHVNPFIMYLMAHLMESPLPHLPWL